MKSLPLYYYYHQSHKTHISIPLPSHNLSHTKIEASISFYRDVYESYFHLDPLANSIYSVNFRVRQSNFVTKIANSIFLPAEFFSRMCSLVFIVCVLFLCRQFKTDFFVLLCYIYLYHDLLEYFKGRNCFSSINC